MRTGWPRLLLTITSLGVITIASAALSAQPAAAQVTPVPGELRAGPGTGISFTMLASRELADTAPATGRTLKLVRWQLRQGESRYADDGVYGVGYVEEGAITVEESDGKSTSYRKGDAVQIGTYRPLIHNDATTCSWVLLAAFLQTAGASASTDEAGPDVSDPIPCDEPAKELAGGPIPQGYIENGTIGWVPDPPGLLFLGRKTWEPYAESGFHRHSGPIAMAIESGALSVGGPGAFRVDLGPGTDISVAAGTPISEHNYSFDQPAVALVVGVIAAREGVTPVTWSTYDDQGLSDDASSYGSPHFGWELTWDVTWSVLYASGAGDADLAGPDGPSEALELANGSSHVRFFSHLSDDPTMAACVDRLASATANREAAVTGATLELANDGNGNPMAQGDETQYAAVYIATPGEGTQMVWVFRCTRLGGAGETLELTWKVPLDAYNDELPRVESLLTNLHLAD